MDLNPKQFARVNVTIIKHEGVERTVDRNFSVDPRTITLDRLQHLVARALDIRAEFSMLLRRSWKGDNVPLSCDWDLEAALAEETRLDLTLELKPKEAGLEEWDIICPADVPVAGHEASSYSHLHRKGSLLEQVFQLRPPSPSTLSEPEFKTLADWPCPLRYATFRANGAESSVRQSLWMHLLNVFPTNAGPREREEFLNRKAEEYYGLRHSWQQLTQAGTIPPVLHDVMCLVRKDVRRTDRGQCLDEHALSNVLTTYAVQHPSIGYWQGMSDLLSPLLYVMKTEACAYVAFCGLMLRMKENFQSDGRSMCTKFRHLRRAIRAHDPQLYEHLSNAGALDLLFCYRWLLLDLKREFPYKEMLQLMEVLWSSLPPLYCEKGVELYEIRFPTATIFESLKEKVDPKDRLTFTENHFGTPKKATCLSLKQWAQLSRRKSIATNIESEDNSSTDEEGGIIHYKRRRKKSRKICRSWSGRDSTNKYGQFCNSNTVHDIQINNWFNKTLNSPSRQRHCSSDSNYGSIFSEDESSEDEASARSRSEGYTSDQNSQQTTTDQSQSDTDQDFRDNTLSFESTNTYLNDSGHTLLLLPPPTQLGDGKPFLLFMCLTMILNHRNVILTQKMDASEIGIYFDHLVRKHKLLDVLPRAKEMFAEYLNTGWSEDD